MLLRVQSPEGTRRVEIQPTDSTVTLFEKIHDEFSLDNYMFQLYRQRNKAQEIVSSRSKTVQQLGLSHGDMIYAVFPGKLQTGDVEMTQNGVSVTVPVSTTVSDSSRIPVKSNVEEDEVDRILQKLDGKIQRKPDPRFCRHGENSSCLNCLPLEPYDEAYLKEQNVKHMSFHAYLRKLSSGLDRGKFANLENISCRIKPGCTGHPPWPKAVCSKCQPKAITLNRQPYRHVDNVMFENPHLVERFLHFWRVTGRQRIGFLYGRHEVHLDVPLGIKAVVAAIYEPPQESTRDSVTLLPDPREEVVEQVARKLGLRRVGWIFTDLIAEDAQQGTVRYFRHAGTYFLSAQECMMAGHFQNSYPNPCSSSTDGYFGSKFTTICVTGDEKNHVHMEGYQVSNQCMALVKDDCLVPTKDAPELGYVRESTASQYVPDVYYKTCKRILKVLKKGERL
nr:EOG090X05T8 [Eulimnadia texana]